MNIEWTLIFEMESLNVIKFALKCAKFESFSPTIPSYSNFSHIFVQQKSPRQNYQYSKPIDLILLLRSCVMGILSLGLVLDQNNLESKSYVSVQYRVAGRDMYPDYM